MTVSHETLWHEVLAKLPLVAILRGLQPTEASDVAAALIAAGFLCVEVPLNSPEPLESIRRIREQFDGKLLVGAGTVLSVVQVRTVRDAGAQLAVSPDSNPQVVTAAKDAGMISIPGFATPTEAFASIRAGADALKLFPAESASPAVLRALKAVLPPTVPILPVGGISIATMPSYLAAGAAGFGIGSSIYTPGLTAQAVGQRAAEFVTAWSASHAARGGVAPQGRRSACALALLGALGLAALGLSAARPSRAADDARPDESAVCAALAGSTIAPDTVIESASYAPAGTRVADTTVSVPFCRVLGVATPTRDSRIGFEVWLPPAASWNGNFRGEGSGASAGAISPGPMGAALRSGFATMSTDNGHLNDPNDPLGASGQRWAYGHPQKKIDWAWRALHLSTIGAKAIVRQYYGRAAARNYFIGCSAGGHHALMEATRFPQDYDGVLAGAAPWKWTSLMLGHTWNSVPALKDPGALTAESVAILHRRMVAACDRLDGVEDGIIADPRRCTVDPVQFQCSDTLTSDCLSAAQVAAARHIYAGAVKSDGTSLMPGQVRGTELGWVPLMNGPHPGGSSWEFWRLSVFQDENFRNADFDFDQDTARALATQIDGASLAAVYDESPDLDAFRARGGKLILFQGWADYQISPLMDVDFYQRLVGRYGQASTDDFLRFFLLPGMGHCSGGAGFSHIGAATGAPLADDSGHDLVRALDAWVRTGKAPEMFVGAHVNENQQVTATRPICRYPLEARYSGHGDTADAANFTCSAPAEAAPSPSPSVR